MLEVLALLVSTVIFVYFWVRRRHSYWSNKGLVQPPTVFGFGHNLDTILFRSNNGLTHGKFYRSYPDQSAIGVYQFLRPVLLLRSPELVKKVMVSDFSSFHDNMISVNKKVDLYFSMDPFAQDGEEWKQTRQKLMSSMSNARLKEIFLLMKTGVPKLYGYIEENLDKDFDAKELATLFTMDCVSNSVFGIESNCFKDAEAPFRRMVVILEEQFQGSSGLWASILVYLPEICRLPGFRFTPKPVNDFIDNMVKDIVKYRLKTDLSGADMFQHYIKKEKISENDDLTDITGFGMTFFLEGFETSSMVASITLYELAMNPEVQETLYKEVLECFKDRSELDFDTLTNNMTYLDKVLQESQRMYPVMYENVRKCTKTTSLEIDGRNVEIEKGTPVSIPVFAIHHDPQYYPDPEVFDPERFNEENKASRPNFTFIPFGEGPRLCPGFKFALAQVKLLLAHTVLKYKIVRTENTPPKLTLVTTSGILVSPNEKLWIRLKKRF